MLELAGRLADLVGIHVRMRPQGFDRVAAREVSRAVIDEKIDRVRNAAAIAGRPAPVLELTPVVVVVDGTPCTATRGEFTRYIADHPDEFAGSPAVLIGSAAQVADALLRWTEELGIGLWHLGSDIEAVGRVRAMLDH